MPAVCADTHTFVWYLVDRTRLSPPARAALDSSSTGGATIHVSAVTLVELLYLVEKGRLPAELLERVFRMLESESVALTVVPLDQSVARAMTLVAREAVPDMPDRIIAATALHLGLPLVTRDGLIRTAGIHTIW